MKWNVGWSLLLPLEHLTSFGDEIMPADNVLGKGWAGICYRHLVGQGQGYCSRSAMNRRDHLNKDSFSQNVNSVKVKKPKAILLTFSMFWLLVFFIFSIFYLIDFHSDLYYYFLTVCLKRMFCICLKTIFVLIIPCQESIPSTEHHYSC